MTRAIWWYSAYRRCDTCGHTQLMHNSGQDVVKCPKVDCRYETFVIDRGTLEWRLTKNGEKAARRGDSVGPKPHWQPDGQPYYSPKKN